MPSKPKKLSEQLENAGQARDFVRVYGARQNNLKNIDVEIPHDVFVAFTGVSGNLIGHRLLSNSLSNKDQLQPIMSNSGFHVIK